jgi:hypothetical protein
VRSKLSQDAWVVLFLVLFLMAFGAFAVKKQTSSGGIEMIPRRTTYSASQHGLKALYETLDELHYRVRRQTQPLTSEPDAGVLFVVAPEMSVSDAEWGSLHRWMEKGNFLVIADDSNFVYEPGEKLMTMASSPCAPSFLARGVGSYRTEAEAEIAKGSWALGKESLPCKGFG